MKNRDTQIMKYCKDAVISFISGDLDAYNKALFHLEEITGISIERLQCIIFKEVNYEA